MSIDVDAWYAERFGGTENLELDKALLVLRHIHGKISFARREHAERMQALEAELREANDKVVALMK